MRVCPCEQLIVEMVDLCISAKISGFIGTGIVG